MQLPLHLSPLLHLASYQISGSQHASNLVDTPCPWLGQIYPPPISISSYPAWQNVAGFLDELIDAIQSVSSNTSSHALQVISLHDDKPIYEHYGKASNHIHGKDGNSPVDGATVFRIASVSKMFTVNALLLKGGFKCFEDPISKYVPELAGHVGKDAVLGVDWDDVTVGALAAQISGIGRDYASGDISGMPELDPRSFGLPEVDPSEVITCGDDATQPPCDRAESIKLMLKHPPAFPTWYTPSYSNQAFQLLSYALQNITGQSFEEVMRETIFKPLGLNHTSVTMPDLADGVMMKGDPTFEWDLGDDAATGGIYSSVNDLAAHARAILNNTQLSASQTRRWLKPHSHTAMIQFSFGAPWEIFRFPGLSSFHNVDLYTKGGALTTYGHPQMYLTTYAIIPELEIAIVAATYSEDFMIAASNLFATVIEYGQTTWYEIAKAQAIQRFTGTYIDERPDVNSSFIVSYDDDIGLLVSEFISNGTDVLETLRNLGLTSQSVRLFPSNLSSRKGNHGKLAFRATVLSDQGTCLSALLADALKYAGIGIDLVVFDTDDAGRAHAVELPAYRARYRRTETMLQVQ